MICYDSLISISIDSFSRIARTHSDSVSSGQLRSNINKKSERHLREYMNVWGQQECFPQPRNEISEELSSFWIFKGLFNKLKKCEKTNSNRK